MIDAAVYHLKEADRALGAAQVRMAEALAIDPMLEARLDALFVQLQEARGELRALQHIATDNAYAPKETPCPE